MSRPVTLPVTEILNSYKAGASARDLALRCRCTVPGILRVLRRGGVPVRPRGRRTKEVSAPARPVDAPEAVSLYRDMDNLLVFKVSPVLHHLDRRVAAGATPPEAKHALREHQLSQPKPAVYLWEDELSLPGVQRMLEHRNGTDTSVRVHARSCEVVEVSLAEARAFYDSWHLQGSCNRLEITLGLRAAGVIVAMMSFSDPQACRGLKVPWMLQRYACVGRVPGAASKLLSAFRRSHEGAIVSYSDNRYSPVGGLYKTLGFDLVRDDHPDYRYWRDGRWYAKSSKQRKNLIQELGGYLEQDTEYTMAQRAGYLRCYDCGKKTWLLPALAPAVEPAKEGA